MIEKQTKSNGPGAIISGKEIPAPITEKSHVAIQPKTLELLQEQIKHELFAERLYYSIATWSDWKGLPQTAKFFSTHAGEEHKHAMMFVNFISKRGEHALFPDTEEPIHDFDDIKAAVDAALEHEYFITERISNIYETACDEKDFLAKELARTFISEQTEEEQLFLSLSKWLEINEGKPDADWEVEVMNVHDRTSHIIGEI